MIKELIQELQSKKIQISFAGGKLKYSGPQENITSELLEKLKANKSKLLKSFWPKECPNMMPINTEGNSIPIIIIHAGEANYLISDTIGKQRPYYGFFNLGGDGDRIPFKDVESFATHYLQQIQYVLPDTPYYLGGFSFGGHLAFEIAIQLQKQGKQVPILFLGDPGLSSELKKMKIGIGKKILRGMKFLYYATLDIIIKSILKLMTPLYKKIPFSIRKNYIIWIYSVLHGKYNPTEKFNGKIVLFKAESNNHELPFLGWENLCNDIKLVSYKGKHSAMYADETIIKKISLDIKNVIVETEKNLKS